MTIKKQINLSKNRIPQVFKKLFFIFAILFQTSSSINASIVEWASTCFQQTSLFTKKIIKNKNQYAFQIPHQAGMEIQFGGEIEFTPDKNSQFLLLNYMPISKKDFNGSIEEWRQLTHEERTEYAQQAFKSDILGQMKLIPIHPELESILPKTLNKDGNNFEIVLDPVSSLDEINNVFDLVVKHLGLGSMQAMISSPFLFNQLKSISDKQEMADALTGYHFFIAELDILNKLSTGYKKLQKNPNQETVKSFFHQFLGPLSYKQEIFLKSEIKDLVFDNSYPEFFADYKFIGATTLRLDKLQKEKRIANEVRDCHKDIECIKNRLKRTTYFFTKGFKEFKEFKKLEGVNFDTLSLDFASTLQRSLNPKEQIFYKNKLRLLNSLHDIRYIRFLYPFRSWRKTLDVFQSEKLQKSLFKAQSEYQQTFLDILSKMPPSPSKNEIEIVNYELQGALAKFSEESGLPSAFNQKLKELYHE